MWLALTPAPCARSLVQTASRKSYLMTDEAKVYRHIGRVFSGHGRVNHSKGEYVRGTF